MMTDFEKVAAYLLVLSIGMGVYPMQMIYELIQDLNHEDKDDAWSGFDAPDDVRDIYESWTEKDEAAFIIYFGNECMKRLEE